jgi:methionyl-tRNA synthetase
MLLGYGSGGEIGAGRAALQLPYDVVASEFLTMEGKRFSTSRAVGIYVSDFLSRYDADQLRYFLAVAGPETQDTDFTWSEFVRRNNDELVAAWGNLVHRTITNVHRHFGEVPAPAELDERDELLLRSVEGGYEAVGAEIERARFKAGLNLAMGLVREVNQYVSEQAPWALLESDRARAATVLYVAVRSIDNLKTLLAPFLPFSSQVLHELLGYGGYLAGPLELRRIGEGDDATHTILTGDYESWVGEWAPSSIEPGQPVLAPSPLFKKLDAERVVEEEVARMEAAAP